MLKQTPNLFTSSPISIANTSFIDCSSTILLFSCLNVPSNSLWIIPKGKILVCYKTSTKTCFHHIILWLRRTERQSTKYKNMNILGQHYNKFWWGTLDLNIDKELRQQASYSNSLESQTSHVFISFSHFLFLS